MKIQNKPGGKVTQLGALTVSKQCEEADSSWRGSKMQPDHLVPNRESVQKRCDPMLSLLIRNLSILLVLSLTGGLPVPTLPTCRKFAKPGRQGLKKALPAPKWSLKSHGHPTESLPQ